MPSTHYALLFLHSAWRDVASRLTGSLSAALILLGLGMSAADSGIIQFAIWLLAAICGGQAAYSIWLREHKERLWFESRINPSLIVAFDPTDEGCDSSDGELSDGTKARSIRLRVENTGTINISAKAFFTIDQIPGVSARPLFWADAAARLTSIAPLVKGVARYLQIFLINDSNQIITKIPEDPLPCQWRPLELTNLFETNNTYMFNIAIKADDYSETIFYDVVLDWTGDWQTAFVHGRAHP
jgi:hypothetical protein